MVTRIDDLGKYYAELSVKAEQNKAEKEAERVRQVNEEAERQRAKRDAKNDKLQGLLAKAMHKENDGDHKLLETSKYEESLRGLAKSLSNHTED